MDTPCDNCFVSAYICLVSTRDGTGILDRLFSFVLALVSSRGYETPVVFDWAVWDNRDVTSFLLVVNSVVPLCGLLDLTSIRGASSAVLQGSGCTVYSVNEEHYIHSNIDIFSTNIYTVSINL